ncbi:dihydrofolate reductase [Kocuria flava]|uniref:dihydrofolate reductase n=1 Tax=Kocuria flava TaxID=446860 RepID=UPI002151A625|nr:dihydrofolate reductase [Kocuria flava]
MSGGRGPVVGAIWAQTPGGVIGRDGGMPWSVPEDLAFFRRTTTGHPVVMGRRTWESFPERFRPLPDRTNIVVTSAPERVAGEGVLTAGSWAGAVERALAAPGAERIWVIGGAVLLAEALADGAHPVTEALVTTIGLDVEGDTFAPVLDDAVWDTEPVVAPSVSRGGPTWRVDRRTRR